MCAVQWLTIFICDISSSITPLPDGVYVTKKGEVASVRADIEVIVLVRPPEQPIKLLKAVQKLRKEIEKVTVQHTLRIRDQRVWLNRVGDMEKQLRGDQTSTATQGVRKRRGLIDGIGRLSKTLFGTATTEDVRRVALAVQHARTREDKVVHQVNQMLTVIKENRDELNETRERVNIVITTVQKYTKALLELTSDTRSVAKNLSEIRKVLMFEQALAQIEVGVNQYKQQLALYRRQRNQLADEKLTPDLLTRTDLMKILNQHCTAAAVPISPIEWYYEFGSVSTIWTGKDVVYHVHLPLLETSRYQMYLLQSFPVLVNGSNTVTQVRVRESIAVDRVTGRSLRPRKCLGQQPTVCRIDTEYKHRDQCERAIVDQLTSGYKHCQISISKNSDYDDVIEIQNQVFVVQTAGEMIEKRCLNERPNHHQLAAGVYVIAIERGCVYEGLKWVVHGVHSKISKMNFTFEHITIIPLQVHDIVTQHIRDFNDTVNIQKLDAVRVVNLEPLKEEINNQNDLSDLLVVNIDALDILIFILIFVLYLAIMIYICYYKVGCIRKCKHKSTAIDRNKVIASAPDPPVELKESQVDKIDHSKNIEQGKPFVFLPTIYPSLSEK